MYLTQKIMPLGFSLLGIVAGAQAVQAQVVATPTGQPGATGTVVTPANQVSNITGGVTAGTNLFHSFLNFSLAQGEAANFQTATGIQNVLSRVSGGAASVINGQISLSGSGANLYFMNPSGVIFGPSASLNVPASFAATTATAIGFQNNLLDNQFYFNSVGNNNYANLTGGPTAFLFPPGATGSIVNLAQGSGSGSFSVSAGNTLALFGGTVLQGADINAPGASVVAASVPAPRVIRLSAPGNLLSLDFPAGTFTGPNGFGTGAAAPVVALPTLITNANFGATNVQVVNGAVRLIGGSGANATSTTINPGDLVTRNINIQLGAGSSGPNVGSVILITGGNLTAGNISNAVAAGANVALNGAAANANSGGTVGLGTVRLVSGFGGVDASGNIVSTGAGTLQVGNIAAANINLQSGANGAGSLSLNAGNLRTAGVTAGRDNAITLSSTSGNVRVITLFANNVNAAGAAGTGSNIVVNVPQGLFEATGTLSSAAIGGSSAGGAANVLALRGANGAATTGSVASVAANGQINITQLGGAAANANLVQGANLERDANGVIVFRLADNQNIRVLINGVNANGSLILRNAETGALIAGANNNVIIRTAGGNAALATATGGGTSGLILRLNGANNALNGALGLSGINLANATQAQIAATTRLNAGSAGVAAATTNGSVASGGIAAAALNNNALPGAAPGAVGDDPVVDDRITLDPNNPIVDDPITPDLDNQPDGTNQLTENAERAQDQIELENTGSLEGSVIRTAANRSGELIVANSARDGGSRGAEEGVLTRRVERQVEVPVEAPAAVPAIVEKKEEDEKIEVAAPKKIKLLPQLW